ncbi:hypothetical protein [Commensalibacter communis]|nr:hypothetical protein [Commensalibacter communis]
MAKDMKDSKDLEKEQDPSGEDNKSESDKTLSNPPPENGKPPSDKASQDDVKEQNGNPPSAFFVSTGTTTVTLMSNRTLIHNGIEYPGGTTLDLPIKDAEFLIKHHYAVAGSLLPKGGIIVPKTHTPKAGSDVD